MNKNNNELIISIVLAVKDEIYYINKCINSILNQTLSRDKYEILVFDGQSSDGTAEYLTDKAKSHSNIRIFNNKKIVAAAGWNEGFRISQAKYLVMMGGHTEIAPDFLERNIEILENHNTPCSGGRVYAVGEDTKSHAISLAFNNPFGVGDARYRYARKKCYVETVNFGMYRKSVTDTIGPLNEEIKRGEDWEYNYQIVKKYGKMIYSPKIKSTYHSRSNFKQLWKRQFDAGLYKLDIIRRYPGSLLLRHLIPFIFVLFALILPLITLIGLNSIFCVLYYIIYMVTNLVFSLYISLKNGLKFLPYLIWTFFIMQFAYGFGFLVGLVKLSFKALYRNRD